MGLMLDPTLNKREDSMPDRERSLLEANIESFLSVLGWEFERQVRINEYYVDYLVKIWKDGKMKEFIL
jgi:very-short-patch-repair endonuclease